MTFLMSLYNWNKCEDYFSCLRHKDNLSEEIRHRFYEALHINVTRSREKKTCIMKFIESLNSWIGVDYLERSFPNLLP